MKYLFILSLVSSIVIRSFAADYYVSPSGNNDNTGNIDSPFKTIQKGVDVANAGDIVHVLPGVYKETVTLVRSGMSGSPITIKAEPGTVLIDGTETIMGTWMVHNGNIYKTNVSGPVEQIFLNDTMLVEARWPNMDFPRELFNNKVWATSEAGSDKGKMVDAALAATGIDWTGALAIMNLEAQFWTWSAPVESHSAGSNTFTYDDSKLNGLRDAEPTGHRRYDDDYYYLMGKLEALDYPGEWFFDKTTNTLYVYKPDGSQPQPGEIKIKRMTYGIIANNKDHVVLSGLDFIACTYNFENGCDYCIIEKCDILYPSYSREIKERMGMGNTAASIVDGNHNIIRQCHIAYASGNGLKINGSNNLLENNLIHDVCWSGTLDYKCINISGPDNIARLNTIYNGGNALISFNGARTIVEYNHIYLGGRLCKDVSIVYTLLPGCEYSQVRNNWVHDVYAYNNSLGIRGDDKTRRLHVYRNVVWNVDFYAITIKGDENYAYNNTVFNSGKADIYMQSGIEPQKDWHDHIPPVDQNLNSYTYNNLTEHMRGTPHYEAYKPVPGHVEGNLEMMNFDSLLINLNERDFRPRFGSGLIDGGELLPQKDDPQIIGLPDIGAYEYGDSVYWIPGYRTDRASSPIPSNSARVSSDIINLIWKQAYNATSYDVYFGNSATSLLNASHASDEFRKNQINNIYTPGDLEKDSTYFWRIDAVYNDTTIKGEVWKFTPLSEAAAAIYNISYKIYGAMEDDTLLLEDVKINTADMQAITNNNGIALILKQSPGYLNYKLSRRGFITKEDSVLILSDTLIVDTLTAAVNAFDLDLKVIHVGTSDFLAGCTVQLNNQTVQTDSTGLAGFNDLSYGFYDLMVEKQGYEPYSGQVEIFSDSTLFIGLYKQLVQSQVHVVDKATKLPIQRAVIYMGDNIMLTNSDGLALVDFKGYPEPIHIEHSDYFVYTDTVEIVTDSLLEILMTRTRAILTLEVYANSEPAIGSSILLKSIVRQTEQGRETDLTGKTFFSNLPARELYAYQVEMEGFLSAVDTLYLEVDSTLIINLISVSFSASDITNEFQFYPNPAKDWIYVNVDEECRIAVFDLHGSQLIEQYLYPGEGRVNLQGIAPGLYLLQLRTGNEVVRTRLFKH